MAISMMRRLKRERGEFKRKEKKEKRKKGKLFFKDQEALFSLLNLQTPAPHYQHYQSIRQPVSFRQKLLPSKLSTDFHGNWAIKPGMDNGTYVWLLWLWSTGSMQFKAWEHSHAHAHAQDCSRFFFLPRRCILLLKCEVSSNTKNKGKVLLVYNIFCNTIGHETRNINLISITKLTINKRNKEIRVTEVYRNIYYCTNRINCY